MKKMFLIAAVALLPSLGLAQDSKDNSLSMMERGAQMFFDGMMQHMAPTLEGLSDLSDKMGPALRSFAIEMGPALGDILSKVEDWSVYEQPKIMPNGDIVIKRKPEPPKDETPKKDVPPVLLLDKTPQIEL